MLQATIKKLRVGNRPVRIRVATQGGNPAVTTYTLTGPSGGTAGQASGNFTVSLGSGTLSGTATITPSDGGAGGTFSPTTVSLTNSVRSGTFTVTESGTGTFAISTTNNGGLSDPSSPSFAVGSAGSLPVTQAFDSNGTGTLSTQIASWSSYTPGTGGAATIVATGSNPTPTSGNYCLGLTPGSGNNALAWYNVAAFGDAVVVASCYVVASDVGLGVVARGSGLSTGSPSYYALVWSGSTLTLKLIKVLSGSAATVASISLLGSTTFNSSAWVRLTLSCTTVSGNIQLQGQLYYQSSGKTPAQGSYLTMAGDFSPIQGWALTYTDSSTPITGTGYYGVLKLADATATRYFDGWCCCDGTTAVSVSSVSASVSSGNINIATTASHAAGIARVEYYVDGNLHDIEYTAPYSYQQNGAAAPAATWSNATHAIEAKVYSFASEPAAGTGSTTLAVSNSPALPTLSLPRHATNTWIRQSTGSGSAVPSSTTGSTGSGSFEEYLLGNWVDFVANGDAFASYINSVTAGATPLGIYTNYVCLYLNLLLDWFQYARANGYDRDGAFWHAASVYTFPPGQDGPSVAPQYFWVAFLEASGGTATDYTTASQSGTTAAVHIGNGSGDAFYLGYPDPFREFNIALGTPATGWSFTVEYPTNLNGSTNPASWTWATAPNLTDTTSGGTVSGQVWWDPTIISTGAWVPGYPASLTGVPTPKSVLGLDGVTPYPLYFARIRTTAGTAPVAITVQGRNYNSWSTSAQTGQALVFDMSADTNGDGFLDSTEYPDRAVGKDAMFWYESRMPFGDYGPQQPSTNCGNAGLQAWAIDYSNRYLAANRAAGAIFSDNSTGQPPGGTVVESTATTYSDCGTLHAAVWRNSIPTGFVYCNTAGSSKSDPLVALSPACQEESFPLPMQATASILMQDEAIMVGRWAVAAPSPLVILDCNSSPAYQCDPRAQMANLTCYYMMSHSRSMLSLCAGFEPASSMATHWLEAITANVGSPTGRMQLWQVGTDPTTTVQAAINAALLTQYTSGQLTAAVTGGVGGPWTITFSGTSTASLLGPMMWNDSGLQPRFNEPQLQLLCHGSSTRNKYYVLSWSVEASALRPSGGTFTLSVDTGGGPQTTSAITYSATATTMAANIQAALDALTNVGAGGTQVSSSVNPGIYTIAFQGSTVGKSDAPVLAIVSMASLTGTAPNLIVVSSAPYTTQTVAVNGTPTPRWGNFTLTIPTALGNLTTGSIAAFASASTAFTYRVYLRWFTNALVLYRPLSNLSSSAGPIDDSTAVTFTLPSSGNTYCPLSADGTIGSAATTVSLRGAEGAIFMFAP